MLVELHIFLFYFLIFLIFCKIFQFFKFNLKKIFLFFLFLFFCVLIMCYYWAIVYYVWYVCENYCDSIVYIFYFDF